MKYLLLISTICLCILTTFSQDLSIARIWKNYEFSAKGAGSYQMLQDGTSYTELDEKGDLVKRSLNETANSEILINAAKLVWNNAPIVVAGYDFNKNEQKVLLWTAPKAIYRRSFEAFYFLYDLKTQSLTALDENHAPQTLAEYSPDGTKVSYIHGNDIFIKDLSSGKVNKMTEDGKRNKIINGTTDWVYEEEFAITKAYGWSPDSKYLAFLKFDEREVPEFQMAMYGELYPSQYTYKYPKAGENNSKVSLHLLQVNNGKSQKVELGSYEYIPRLNWSESSNQLVVQTMNRYQNELTYWLLDCNLKQVSTKQIYQEKSTTYVEVDDNLHILQDGKSFLRCSEMSGYNHIYRIGFDGSVKAITTGNWDVIEFLGIDQDAARIYYSSAEPGAIYKSIYAIQLDGTQKNNLTPQLGYHSAEFLNGMKYFVHNYSNANTPPVTSLRKASGELVRHLEQNTALLTKMNGERLNPRTFLTIQTPAAMLNASLILPLNYDPSKKYPVFVNVYGGPGHNEVLDCWDGNDYFFHQLLAQNGYMVLSIDPRGTQYRGADFKKSTYLQLGKLEIEDILAATKEFAKRPDVDAARLGIMGWSYGGFMSSLAMTKGQGLFKVGIAVAPVTNWRYYDNIYTERFLRTPQENAKGYDENSPINFVKDLEGKYFLIHGSADDNVHYQNSMEMITALVKANKQFDLFIYPNKNHGIYGGNTRNHLFEMIFDYLKEEL
ncbi:MAG: S9 family peptidase [Flavobacteriales bacterium]